MSSKSKKHKSTMMTVGQLVDLALGNPEIGSVNFNVLHALLHVIIQQINIQECLVEFKGSDSERMEGLILTAKPGPILKVTEYMIKDDGKPCVINKDAPPQTTMDQPTENQNIPLEVEDTFNVDDLTDDEKLRRGPDGEAPPEKKKRHSWKNDGEVTEGKKKEEESHFQGTESENESKKLSKRKPSEGVEGGKAKEEDRKKNVCPCKAARIREDQAAMGKHGNQENHQSHPEVKHGEKSEKCNVICPDMKLKNTSLPYYSGSKCRNCQTIVRVEAIGERCDTWRSRPALAHESLVKLEEKVTLLQEAFEALEKMPSNEELKKKSCSDPCPPTPIKDMWQLYNLNKRMESCEGAIEKMASMIEDVVKETCNVKEAMMVVADAVDSMEANEEIVCRGVSSCCGAGPGEPHRGQPAPQPPQSNQQIIAYSIEESNPGGPFEDLAKPPSAKTSEIQTEEIQTEDNVQATEVTEPEQPQTRKTSVQVDGKPNYTLGPDFFKLTNPEKFCVLKEGIECLTCQLKSFTQLIPMDQLASKLCSMVTTQKQFDNHQKEWETFLQCFSSDGIPGACSYIKRLNQEIEMINNTIERIFENRRQLEMTIESITQDISILKTIKVDKETMEDLLAEKADAAVVNRKVSHDQFDAACDDLTKGLDEALEKLIAQELMWNEAMEELQRDLDCKLDKVEIMPLKEFINKKLKSLQEKLQQLAELRKDAEAAGAKSRILRNLNCIACDNDVIMRMDNKNTLQHTTANPNRSMKPYITYELDQVRKALKKGPNCRPTCNIDDMMSEIQKKNVGLPLGRESLESKMKKLEHYCNRYCGGSHTITTAQQRVTRIGHFLTEFGPHALAMLNQENTDYKPQESGNQPIPNRDIKLL